MSKLLKYSLIIWSLVGIALLTLTSLLYLNWNGFIEQGEITFSTVSYLFSEGYPIYVAIDAAEQYSIQHGPIIYIIIGSFMELMGPSYLTAKLANITALLLTIIISWLWYSNVLNKKTALFLLGLECWCLLHWTYSYLSRPDSIMLLCMTVGTYIAATKRSRLWLILGTAIPLGIMINLKIHGFIYFLPILALIYQYLSWKDFLKLGCITIILAIAPFLLPQVSLENYFMWLTMSLSHGIYSKKYLLKQQCY